MFELLNKIAALAEFKKPTRGRISFVVLSSWVSLFLVFSGPNLLASQQSEPKNILVLFSFRPTLPVASKWDRGIRSIFEAEPNLKVDINIEYLDLSRFNNSYYIKMIFSVFRHKYFESKPDLIIAVFEPALDFLLRHQEDLFPGVPIVFGGVERVFIESQVNKPDITGVYAGNSFIKTLETALNLHPNTRHIRIFVGAGMVAHSWAMAARKAYVRYEDQYDFVYVPVQSIEDLLKKVAELPPDTLILYLPIIKDSSGKTHVAREVLSRVSEVSTAPVYGFWRGAGILGGGIVGGHLSSFEEQAKAVAKIGLRILQGARAADIPPIDTPGFRYMFDWQQLKRWSISEDRLPPGSIVKFKKLTVWDKYKGHIIAAFSLIIFQTLIIILLLHQRRLRRRTEYELRDRLQFERKLSELSSEFINLAPDKLDAKITDTLAWIGPFMRADRSHTFRFNWDRTEFRITHIWETEGVKKDDFIAPGLIVKDTFPWLFDHLIGGRDVIIPDVDILSTNNAINEYQYCRTIGIQSFIILPIQMENAPLCAIGLDSINQKREWPKEVQDRLRIIGEIFTNAIARRHAEKKSEMAALKYRTVADYTYDWEYWVKTDGSLQYVSPSCERISGYSAQDFKKNPGLFGEIIVHEDKGRWEAHNLSSEKHLKPGELQFRIQRKDGGIRWIEHVCQPVTDAQGVFLGFRASNRDITERKQAELDAQRHRAQLTHVSRIATLGELSAALAHELNQPLTAILSNAQAARRFLTGDTADPDEINEILSDIINDDKRAADMIKRLRALMRRKDLELKSMDLNNVVLGVAEIVNREAFTKRVPLVLELTDGLPYARGDAIHLEQVILNLILNGSEAMETVDHQSRELRILTVKHDENALRVSVRDKGTGIDETPIESIFEAFYTTKPEGMGMGLSICRSIIEAHGGRLWAENNLNGGTTVSFTVPISTGDEV